MATPLTSSAPRLLTRHARHAAAATAARRSLTTTTTTTSSAADAAQQLERAFEGRTWTRRQVLDPHQLQKLSLALGRPELPGGPDVSSRPPPPGTPLPPGYHLAWFAPAAVEAELGPDGTDRSFNAPPPFTRRMWAGGRMRWGRRAATPPAAAAAGGGGGGGGGGGSGSSGPAAVLRVGDEVEERTRFLGAAAKRSRRAGGGGEMVLVDVEKEFWGPDGLALVDRRSWVFRPPVAPPAPADAPARPAVGDEGDLEPVSMPRPEVRCSSVEDVDMGDSGPPQRRLSWSPVALFRFSALTFNAHMIHYNESWARNVEGHPGLVVHGPLNLISMMDYWRDVHGHGREAAEISYRALSPLYAGDVYTIRTDSVEDTEEGKTWEIAVARGDKIYMRGSIIAHA